MLTMNRIPYTSDYHRGLSVSTDELYWIDRGQKTEDRRQRTEDRRQMAEDRLQGTRGIRLWPYLPDSTTLALWCLI